MFGCIIFNADDGGGILWRFVSVMPLIIDTKDGIVEISPSNVIAIRRFAVERVARSADAHDRFALCQVCSDEVELSLRRCTAPDADEK